MRSHRVLNDRPEPSIVLPPVGDRADAGDGDRNERRRHHEDEQCHRPEIWHRFTHISPHGGSGFFGCGAEPTRITATASCRSRLTDGGTGGSAQRGSEVGAKDGGQHGGGDPRVAVSLNAVANRGVVADCAEVIDESLTDG